MSKLESTLTVHCDEDGGLGIQDLLSSIELPNRQIVPNRLVKVALYEHCAALFGGPPNEAHYDLYRQWHTGRWGMIITGNVQVTRDHLSLGRDMIIPEVVNAETVEPFKRLAAVIHGDSQLWQDTPSDGPIRPLAILQLSHAGRQSANILGGRWPFVPPLAPSAIPLGRSATGATRDSGLSSTLSDFIHAFAFQVPRPMSMEQIDEAADAFVKGARVAAQSGFDGVELHAAHGYLLAQFISSKTNKRDDEYSVQAHSLRLLHRIVTGIRTCEDIPRSFILGVKLNAADYVSRPHSGNRTSAEETPVADEDRALDHVREIASWDMVEFIEVSGGDYENAEFMDTQKSARQALFAHFSRRAMQALSAGPLPRHGMHTRPGSALSAGDAAEKPGSRPPLILLTGGFRSLPLLVSALRQQHAHLLGVGRLSVLCPDLPARLHSALSKNKNGSAPAALADLIEEPDLGVGRPPPPGSLSRSLRYRLERALVSAFFALWSLLPVELPKLVGAGANMAWHIVMMRRVAAGREVDYSVGGLGAVVRMWLWTAPASETIAATQDIWDSWVVMGLIGVVIGLVVGMLV
ncbi:FMN-linked oxidoreductase [Obba rivulosa]|uniref:FMN-linked oxidoreductase n=1 Tax=Obba rivulosa TaxID=1052685 RepID=A0A8E2AJI2_9APHY|nr:FMN-linked oxidoreductase [Obba rivulosa]